MKKATSTLFTIQANTVATPEFFFIYWIGKAVSTDVLTGVKQVGIDETSTKKGHNYVIIFAGLETGRSIHVTLGKDAGTISDFVVALEDKKGNQRHGRIERVPAVLV